MQHEAVTFMEVDILFCSHSGSCGWIALNHVKQVINGPRKIVFSVKDTVNGLNPDFIYFTFGSFLHFYLKFINVNLKKCSNL